MDNELKNWFINVVNKVGNDKILMIDIYDKSSIERVYNLSKSQNAININFIYDSNNNDECFSINVNSLVYLKLNDKYAKTNILAKDIIYVSNDNFINEFEKFLYKIVEDINLVNENYINTLSLEEIDYEELKQIRLKDVVENKETLLESINTRKKLLKNILGYSRDYSTIEKTSSGYRDVELEEHISILKTKNVLIAKLAHYLYKIFMLNFTSSTTRIGLNISKELNSKSKTFNIKSLLGKSNGFGNRKIYENTKAYDLNINQIELDTKKRIAKNLLKLDKKFSIDTKTIAKVTELPEKDILKMKMTQLLSL